MVTRLPRKVYVLQAGLLVNALGNGATNPFLVIYLHDVRGIPLGIAGLAAATAAGSALAATLVSGSLGDRLGARPTMIGGLALSTLAYLLYPLVQEPWHALALAAVGGAGIGTWLTLQSVLLAAIVPVEVRHLAFAQQRVVANVGLGLGGFLGGILVTTRDPATFTVLFLANAATFLVYTGFLLALRAGRVERRARPGSYLDVLSDGVFLRFLALNLVFVAGTIALVNALFPVFAKDEAGVSEDAIGVLFLLNSLLIVVAQIPVARAVEGHLRMRGFALMGVLFAVCWTLVLAGGLAPSPEAAFALFAVAVASLSAGECLYDSIQGPLTAALAPERLTGRYLAANGFSWQLGFILGPGIGGVILALEPSALWLSAVVLALGGAVYALRLDRVLPAAHRRTPRRAIATLDD